MGIIKKNKEITIHEIDSLGTVYPWTFNSKHTGIAQGNDQFLLTTVWSLYRCFWVTLGLCSAFDPKTLIP